MGKTVDDQHSVSSGVTLGLLGVLLLLGAASAYGVTVYEESGLTCSSLAVGFADSVDAVCEVKAGPRRALVIGLLVVGLGLLAAAVVWRRRPVALSQDDAPDRLGYSLAWFALAVPVVQLFLLGFSHVLVLTQGPDHVGLPDGWAHLFTAAAVLVACIGAGIWAGPRAHCHVAAAAAVAVPVVLLLLAVLQASDVRQYAAWEQIGAGLGQVDNAFFSARVWLVVAGATAVALVLAVYLSRTERGAPGPTTSAGLVAVSAVVATAVLTPDLVPDWQATAPGPSVWIPVLLAPCLVSLVAVGRAAARRAATALVWL